MDRYKFRGKRIGCDCKDFGMAECECNTEFNFPEEFYKDGFVYGQLVASDIIALGVVETHDSAIVYEYWARVEPSTVGQYTGETDIEGTELYEQDKVQHVDAKWIGTIYFKDGAYRIRNEAGSWELLSYRAKKVKRVKGE